MPLSHLLATQAALLRAAAGGDRAAFELLRRRTWRRALGALRERGVSAVLAEATLSQSYEHVRTALLAGRGPSVELVAEVVSRSLASLAVGGRGADAHHDRRPGRSAQGGPARRAS